jgi:hypothetical protein
MTAPNPGSMRRRDEAVVVMDEEGTEGAQSTTLGKQPGSRVAHEDDPERDLAWAVDGLYIVVVIRWD